IGREVITRAHAFGLKVIAWSRSLTDEEAKSLGVERCATVDDVFRGADIVSLHVALKPETKKLVTAERLALLKPGAILINTARGDPTHPARRRSRQTNSPQARPRGRHPPPRPRFLRPQPRRRHRRFRRPDPRPSKPPWHTSRRRFHRAGAGRHRRGNHPHHRG